MSENPVAPGQPAQRPEAAATVQHEGGAALEAPWFIAFAIVVVFALLIWKRVPAAIGRALDSRIELIRDQLAEAETLRKEAEALKAEYEAKAKSADKDRETLIERARHEADEIVAKAK